MSHVLIVDEDSVSSHLLREAAREEGLSSVMVTSIRQASMQISLQRPDIIFTAHHLSDGAGLSLLDAGGESRRIIVIAMMAEPSVDAVIDAWRLGATDCLTKPLDLHRVRRWLRELPVAATDISGQPSSASLLGISAAMKTLSEHINRVAPTEATVLCLARVALARSLWRRLFMRKALVIGSLLFPSIAVRFRRSSSRVKFSVMRGAVLLARIGSIKVTLSALAAVRCFLMK